MPLLLDGRYDIGEAIGVGGAARVHRAVDRRLERNVAIKLLDDDLASTTDPAGRDRFLRESRTAAGVQHPNLVTVYDAGDADGRLYIVMELVGGCTLARRLADSGPLPPDEAVDIARQVLAGLSAVHERGVVHRDIKPGNILLGDDGRVRLTDFGIARELDRIGEQVTAEGIVVGTPHYLAPEQARGDEATPATDVYAVGVVLDEMLTCRRRGATTSAEVAAYAAATAERFDPRTETPETPAALAEIVMRATEPDAGRRFESVEAFSAALATTCPRLDAGGDDDVPATVAMDVFDSDGFTSSDAQAVAAESPATAVQPLPPSDAPYRRPARRAPVILGVVAAVALVAFVGVVAMLGDGSAETVEGAVSTAPPPSASYEGTTMDGRVVEIRPSALIPFRDGEPVAIQDMTAAMDEGCEAVIAQRDRWAADVGGERFGDAASVFTQHAQNIANLMACNPGPIPVD
ncbi:MAG: serine/threonine protein kinase [Ilumatobacter sp.]|nr:serine/threonine protein kinase [Ilumatobacter sp.]